MSSPNTAVECFDIDKGFLADPISSHKSSIAGIANSEKSGSDEFEEGKG
jgi:hypothetical protein